MSYKGEENKFSDVSVFDSGIGYENKSIINISENSTENFRDKVGMNSLHGISYQLKLLALFLLRGLRNNHSFNLATEMKDAEKFDDVVFRIEIGGKYIFRLLQAKHIGEGVTRKITFETLTTDNDNNDFALPVYFRSYLKLKDKFTAGNNELQDLILCTNANFEHGDMTGQFKLRDAFEYIKDDIFQTKLLRLRKQSDLGRQMIKFLKLSLGDVYDGIEHDAGAFLDKLVFAFGQPDADSLRVILIEELRKVYNFKRPERVYSLLEAKLFKWMTTKEPLTYYSSHLAIEFIDSERSNPVTFNFNGRVRNFVGRRRELNLLRQAYEEVQRSFVISGIGGIGKSWLARKFITDNLDIFHNIIWLRADSRESLLHDFRKLAVEILKISNDKQDESIVEEVYHYFKRKECVFVFDNVKKQSEGSAYIHNFLPYSSKNHFIILTSRYQSWGDLNVLSLSVFSESEAEYFLRNSLNSGVDEDLIKTLANKLWYFPLALQQAVAFIKDKSSQSLAFREAYSIWDFLKLYEMEPKQLLDFKLPFSIDNFYPNTTFTTWKITLNNIQSELCGDTAYEVLKLLSYLSLNNIDRKEIMIYFKELPEELIKKSLYMLKQYSLISLENNTISIIPLVQKLVKLILKEEGYDEKVLKWVLELCHELKVEHNLSVWETAFNNKGLLSILHKIQIRG